MPVLAPRAPKQTSWPRSWARIVTVLADGPSVAAAPHRLSQAVLGPVIAINRALRFSSYVGIDYWAGLDDPKNIWDTVQEHRPETLRYLTCHSNLVALQGLGVPLRRIYALQATSMPGWQTSEDAAPPYVPTIVHVLAWCLKHGVKEVRLIGADMTGPSPEISEQASALRWAVERTMLAQAMRLYRAKGARIRRWHL